MLEVFFFVIYLLQEPKALELIGILIVSLRDIFSIKLWSSEGSDVLCLSV